MIWTAVALQWVGILISIYTAINLGGASGTASVVAENKYGLSSRYDHEAWVKVYPKVKRGWLSFVCVLAIYNTAVSLAVYAAS